MKSIGDGIEEIIKNLAKLPRSKSSSECPSEEEMACYLDCSADADLDKHIEHHILNCDFCRELVSEDRLAQAEGFHLPMPFHLRKKLKSLYGPEEKVMLLDLVFKAGKSVLKEVVSAGKFNILSPVAVRRNAAEHRVYKIRLGGNPVKVAVSERNDGTFDLWLRVGDLDESSRSISWQLWTDDRLIEHVPAERGEAVFSGLAVGSHCCILRDGNKEVGRIRMTLTRDDDKGGEDVTFD